jgi:hypothetical protein
MKSILLGALAALFSLSAVCWGATYKCTQPDGSITFQQTTCASEAEQAKLDTSYSRTPIPTTQAPQNKESIEDQLRWLQEDTRKTQEERERRRRSDRIRGLGPTASHYDAERCTYYSGRVDEYERRLRRGYRNQDDKMYLQNTINRYKIDEKKYCTR